MTNNWLKGFTVLEMLINIAITAIVVGMVYYTYSSFTKQVLVYQESVLVKGEVDSFLVQLKTDVFECEQILRGNNSFEMVFYDGRRIEYLVLGEYLVRGQNQKRDSLRIKGFDYRTIKSNTGQVDYVNWIEFETFVFKQTVPFAAFKEYPSILRYK